MIFSKFYAEFVEVSVLCYYLLAKSRNVGHKLVDNEMTKIKSLFDFETEKVIKERNDLFEYTCRLG